MSTLKQFPTHDIKPLEIDGLYIQGYITQYPGGILVNVFTWLDDGTTLSAESAYKTTDEGFILLCPADLAWSGADDDEDRSSGLDEDLKRTWELISDAIVLTIEERQTCPEF